MNNKTVYCLDCESDFMDTLKNCGFDIQKESLGYRLGIRSINEPPNECDVMVFNLIKPGYFDMDAWAHGNDNFRCTLVQKIDQSMYVSGGRFGDGCKYPRFKLIKESQMTEAANSTFNYSHIQKAISDGGIDCIYYLNPCFMFHSLYDTPHWIGLRFSTYITKARKWNISDRALRICSSLDKMGKGDLEFISPIEFKLLEHVTDSKDFSSKIDRIDLIATNVNECLAAIVKFGKGFIYFLPPFVDPVKGTVALISDIMPAFRDAFSKDIEKAAVSRFASLAIGSSDKPTSQNQAVDLDDLLGILRRKFLDNELPGIIKQTINKKRPISLIMIDVDHFKKFNDDFGHPIGDDVLKKVAVIISEVVDDRGHVIRYGGEEITVILPNFYDEEASGTAEKIRKNIEKYPFRIDDGTKLITV